MLFWEARLLAPATLNLGIIVKVQKDYIRRALKHTKSTVHEKHINLMTIQTYNVSISSLGGRCSEPLETYSSNLLGKFSLYQKIEACSLVSIQSYCNQVHMLMNQLHIINGVIIFFHVRLIFDRVYSCLLLAFCAQIGRRESLSASSCCVSKIARVGAHDTFSVL